ncbi:hypothetical protein FA15DRAFT_710527 [Coprinopsis marcescibilis]|uniref:Uncharacterized protein n=1 Tax=Coprinopsis marcescibilis TaxID=230819 RepID=A0A5C3KCS3_COPMA|nr:hypothetical protein FA15DRAFT_710527 [Coprinopsis marcescibilis]
MEQDTLWTLDRDVPCFHAIRHPRLSPLCPSFILETISGGVQKLLIYLGVMQVAHKVPFDNPVALHSSSDDPKLVMATVRDYDLQEKSKLLRTLYMGLAMMAIMHFYFKFTQPLFIQSLIGLKSLYDAMEVAIHLLGKEATVW